MICAHCGGSVPEDGMTYCGKACSALGPHIKYAHLFNVTSWDFQRMNNEQRAEFSRQMTEAMCPKHFGQFKNTCSCKNLVT